MLLTGYKKEIFKPECNPHFESLHCFAHLENDIGEVIPYLNTVLGGTAYQKNPPSVMFQVSGRLIAIHPRKIAINALKDEHEADKIEDIVKAKAFNMDLDAVSVYHLVRLTEIVGSIADHAENAGDMMRAMLAK